MCGIVHTDPDTSYSKSVENIDEASTMPPSITVGTDHVKPTNVTGIQDDSIHLLHDAGAASNKEIPTIDLASADERELQQAIVLSLQSSSNPGLPGISAEDRDVSKVIEDSMFDASSQSTVDILNPLERKRIDGTPVGLKNIGNSCWFNVVIQPLFHIPFFRDMIINYPKQADEDKSNFDFSVCTSSYSNRLVPTFRKIFGLLIGSEKKYIDPTEAVDLFQGNEMRKNTQQDVCEFIHKLLEKLEEDFKFALKVEGVEKEILENNMKESDFMKLFYGQVKKEAEQVNGEPKMEIFGQYPLTVKQYGDIHESILASMVSESSSNEIEEIQQDTWFKTLPSVLIFSLSRYEFSKEKQRAEKVHNKFDFPQYLFMDRYMELNKEIVKEKHIKISKIKKDLKGLYSSLANYEKFGSGDSKYPLVDILKYALEFSESKSFKNDEECTKSPIDMEIGAVENVNDEDIEMVNTDEEQLMKPDAAEQKAPLIEETIEMSPNKRMRVMPPAPQTLNPGELSVLQTCLPRWKNEVEMQVNHLKILIHNLEEELGLIFEDARLSRIPYKLHAVVVHEGQASGGHYWVYIHDSVKDIWMKFNDIQVVVSNWQELIHESIGGQNNASAYCLMYIDETKHEMLFSAYNSNPEEIIKNLPVDIQEFVKLNNNFFMKEQQDWENKLIMKQSTAATDGAPFFEDTNVSRGAEVPATAPNSPEILCLEDEDVIKQIEIHTMLPQIMNGTLVNENTQKEFMQFRDKSAYLSRIVESDLDRLKELASSKVDHGECSVLDLGIYLIKNGEDHVLLLWHGYEILYHLAHSKIPDSRSIVEEAKKLLRLHKEKYGSVLGAIYQEWKKNYFKLLNCCWHLIYGYRKFNSKNYEIALLHFTESMQIHQKLQDSKPNETCRTLDIAVLSFFYRKCLEMLNTKYVEILIHTTKEDDAKEIIQKMHKIVVPAIFIMLKNNEKADLRVNEQVINKWCMLIDKVSEEKARIVKEIVEIITTEMTDVNMGRVCCPTFPTVLGMYKEYKDILVRFSEEY